MSDAAKALATTAGDRESGCALATAVSLAPGDTFYSELHGEEQKHTSCTLCGAHAERLLFEVEDTMFGRPGKYRLVECQQCSMRYINPRPTTPALARHYPNDYLCYTNFDHEHWLLRWAFNRMQQDQARRRVRQIERVTGRLPQGTTVLDVGCGRGELLRRLKNDRQTLGTGIDINRDVVDVLRRESGIPVLHGTLCEVGCESASFDLVTLTEYLEHEPHPRPVIEEVRRIIKPGGFVAIEVPDISGPPGRWFGPNWWQIDAPRHLTYFSPKTLTQLLESSGFEVLQVKRYSMLTSMGYSLLQAMGHRYCNSPKLLYLTLSALLGLPFVPFLSFLPDFMMVVARPRQAAHLALPPQHDRA